MRRLRMENDIANTFFKIWVFWTMDWQGQVELDTHQQTIIKFTHLGYHKEMMITTVYATCSALKRLELWNNMEDISENIHVSWIIGVDFNIILNDIEKLGRFPVTQYKTSNFVQCISLCILTKLEYSCSYFTRWNGRIEEKCIFKRLEIVLANQDFFARISHK